MTALIPVGTPIAAIAPCSAYDPAKLNAGLEIARAHGHNLHLFPGMLAPERQHILFRREQQNPP